MESRFIIIIIIIIKLPARDVIRLRYDWPIPDSPLVCVCGCYFSVDHAMICQYGGLVIQCHNEIRDLEAGLLKMVCHDVEIEPYLKPIAGEELNRGANKALNARLDVHCRGFWERQRAAFFDIWYVTQMRTHTKNLPQNRSISCTKMTRVTEVEKGTFTPLVITTTGGMANECLRYHSRLAELIAAKKQETYSKTISWIRAKVSFEILRSALLCIRGSRAKRRRSADVKERDLKIDKESAGLN